MWAAAANLRLLCAVSHTSAFAKNAALVAGQWQRLKLLLAPKPSPRLDMAQVPFSSLPCDPTGIRIQPTSFIGTRSDPNVMFLLKS